MDGELMVIQLENLVDLGKQTALQAGGESSEAWSCVEKLGKNPNLWCGAQVKNWNVPKTAGFSDAEPKTKMI